MSFVDGKKYRYEKGDWAKYIQPITNRLCQEYGLSIIDVDDEQKGRGSTKAIRTGASIREGSFVWADMIKRDLDACILQAGRTMSSFSSCCLTKGYQVKQGKHLAVKPQGMTRVQQVQDLLGNMYSEEAIRDRIEKEDIAFYPRNSRKIVPNRFHCKVQR